MSTSFKLSNTASPQVLRIPGGAIGSHVAYLSFAAPPAAGSVTIEYRSIGSVQWKTLQKATSAPLVNGELAVRLDGPLGAMRVTFADVADSQGPELWLSTNNIPDGLYGGLAAITSQTYDECNKKRGLQWEASRRVNDVAIGASIYSIILTGDTPVDLKSRTLGYTGESIRGRIYKGPTYTGGTPDPWYNMNPRYLGTQPQAQLLTGFTLTNNGVQAGADIIGIGPSSNQSRGATPREFGSNRILDEPNMAYLLEIINDSNAVQDVMARLEIYEGGLDIPL